MRPLLLPANRTRALHRGSGRLAAFRGLPAGADDLAEDWIASTTARAGRAASGLTTLPDGRLLRAAIAADPFGWLGLGHLERHGPDTALLVTLVDAGSRTPLHAHAGRDVAQHLGSPHDGTTAWVVLEAEPGAAVHLGFCRDVDGDELAHWVEDQKVESMLSATNRVPVRAGDALLCPAGVPHAVGPGVLVAEVRQPADLAVLLEWEGFAVDGPRAGHLGLGWDRALRAVDRVGWGTDRIEAELRGPAAGRPARDGVRSLLPPAADGTLRAERVEARPRVLLDAAFSVLVVLAGNGLLAWAADDDLLEVSAGDAVLVPHGAGACRIEGPLTALRCRPAA